MSSDIYAQPKKVRYIKKEEEDQAEWEEREVNIYESADNVTDSRTNVQSLDGVGPETQNHPSRGTLCIVAVLCIGVLAGTISLSIHSTLKINRLQTELSDTRVNSSQLQGSYEILSKNQSHLKDDVKKLKEQIEVMTVNSSQLQDEVKKLKEKIEGKWCPDGWKKFGCSCYFKSTEKKNWFNSRRLCQERGADLVIINSKEEHEFVRKLNGNGESWIGLQSSGYEWKWVDGAPLTEQFWETGPAPSSSYYYAVFYNSDGKSKASTYYDKNWICEK
ncbi:uncharacterized protein [Leuresthes tenuis]|uniref:uncharacterized protein n=1 Tax=Leuresthes tenuis TaxID=355514 RepID=UPI003B5031CA